MRARSNKAFASKLLTLIAVLSVALGLVVTLVLVAAGFNPLAPRAVDPVLFDRAAQDDYILAVAEAFFLDSDYRLARDRLARLHEPDLPARVESLALDYAPQRDVASERLAGLALALGSENPDLIAMNLRGVMADVAELATPTELRSRARRDELAARPLRAVPTETRTPTRRLETLRAPSPTRTPVPSRTPTALPTRTPLPSQTPTARPSPTQSPTTTPSPRPSPTAPTTPLAMVAQINLPNLWEDGWPRIDSLVSGTPLARVAQINLPNLWKYTLPTLTPTPAPTRAPLVARMPVAIPDYAGAPSTSIPLYARPDYCTPASAMPAVVGRTIALCPGQVYGPFQVQGQAITIYGDSEGTALVRGWARGFGITATGRDIAIVGVHVAGATDPADLNTWLCFYGECGYNGSSVKGGTGYGGGILLDNVVNGAVASSTVTGGTIGVAVRGGSYASILKNNLSGMNGWGVLLTQTTNAYVVANTLDRANRACTTPDGNYLQSGCESAGLAVIQVQDSTIYNNHCEGSGNCYYANGMGGYGSNNNRFLNNYCAAATANCFEVTFSQGNRFDYNVATANPNTGEPCIYPFWIGGSSVQFGSHNTWACKFSPDQSLQEARASTAERTEINPY